ncbi:MAG: winged helix DNA-binding protein [Pseudomonadota bacterium]
MDVAEDLTNRPLSQAADAAYLELFFPIHYIVGMAIEDTLRSGVLTRQQTCILWTIRAKGVDGKSMRRKDIERALSSWFEVTSSAVSKSLRALAKPPFGMIRIVEDPNSGREKLVHLTPHGERFLKQAIHNGHALMRDMIAHLSQDEVESGIHFLSRVTDVFERELSKKQSLNPQRGD